MANDEKKSIYVTQRFQSRDDVAQILVARGLSLIADRTGPTMLDLGCGSGAVAITALANRDDLRVVALDISAVNVAATREAADRRHVGDRLVADCGDFITWHGGPFELVISDGVLHLIEAGDIDLVRCLVTKIARGGFLIATVPVSSKANSVRLLARRIWRALPSAADEIAMLVARRLYPQFSRESLADRLIYLRVLPARLMNDRLLAEFEGQGLQLVEQSVWPSPSIAKLDHNLFVWRRR
jgi:trans-aconitate 2-methyltransferase